jgi:hypothetical protein
MYVCLGSLLKEYKTKSDSCMKFISTFRFHNNKLKYELVAWNMVRKYIIRIPANSFFFTDCTAALDPGLCFFSFMIIFTDGRIPWTSYQLVARPQLKHIHTPYEGFEPTVPASERAKTVHALDSSATVTDTSKFQLN